jgi:hypothetical protein
LNAERMALVLRLLGIGWYVAVCIAGGTYGGFLLDRKFELSPLLTLLGLGLGIAVAVVGMMRMILAVFAAKPDE